VHAKAREAATTGLTTALTFQAEFGMANSVRLKSSHVTHAGNAKAWPTDRVEATEGCMPTGRMCMQ